ncbi:MAG: helix-turn-helix domain-containing protein [Saccharolobus sp.]|jgi:sugar-specific transcriptional regulator TrmB|uniref:TrmB family transcriptional regulator n=1 Tax=Saccharolobus sp. TaxID=2100761 RepID=UPI0028CF9A26|nr:helix-turn-helix domain-containing protein [Saccharolobus sp.]MDT7862571.1 helix-turn-helix domain-containing protein [Saccharolobus sp.]
MNSELKHYLEDLGLSEYESRAYLALLTLCSATMKELAEKSNVPYQKIYEVSKSLENKGLLKIIEGKPKRVKIIDPSISLKMYRDKIVSRLNEAISKIISYWNEKRKGDGDRSVHVKGKKTIIRLVKDLAEKSSKMKIVYDSPPDWLIKIIRQFKGELILVTAEKLDLPSIRVNNVKSRFIIFDESLLVTFNGEDEAIVDSCKGCIIQANEHFELLTNRL